MPANCKDEKGELAKTERQKDKVLQAKGQGQED